nr:MAG TPA_asm: Repressor protein CI [Caudoviricetes sp.]
MQMFNERLKTLRIQRKMTQSELAKKIYISQPAYSKYEVGTASPNPETLSKIADALDVSVDYLLGSDSQTARPGYIRIPVLGRVAAGIPIDAIEEVIDWEDISAEVAGDGEYFGLQIKGHSMEPKISDGDVVIVRRQPDVDSGDIAVVLVNGDDATVKRIKKSPQGVTLIPSNPAYEPMYYSNDEIESLPVQILGRVVELRAKL